MNTKRLERILTHMPEGRHWPFKGRIYVDVYGTLNPQERETVEAINRAKEYDVTRQGSEMRITLPDYTFPFSFEEGAVHSVDDAVHISAKYHGIDADVAFFDPSRRGSGTVYMKTL